MTQKNPLEKIIEISKATGQETHIVRNKYLKIFDYIMEREKLFTFKQYQTEALRRTEVYFTAHKKEDKK